VAFDLASGILQKERATILAKKKIIPPIKMAAANPANSQIV